MCNKKRKGDLSVNEGIHLKLNKKLTTKERKQFILNTWTIATNETAKLKLDKLINMHENEAKTIGAKILSDNAKCNGIVEYKEDINEKHKTISVFLWYYIFNTKPIQLLHLQYPNLCSG